jgi:CRISPR-associated endonuclease/helicase Cas3
MRGQPTSFWGKLRTGDDQPVEWHPLADHCADVAAWCEALLQTTLLGRRLALLAGRSAFSSGQVARLSVLAALHDIGKFNLGFQNKALVKPPFVTGHVSIVLGLFGDDDKPEQQRLIESMRLEVLERWGLGDASLRLLIASICHHGRAVEVGQGFAPRFWQSARGLDPFAGIADLTALTRYWFPSAFNDDVEAFPENSEFQHAFSGLVMLADWLGSDDERFFPFSTGIDHASRIEFARQQAAFALKEVGLDPADPRQFIGQEPLSFERISEYPPRDFQRRMLELAAYRGGSIALLEAETGAGKTEAALARYATLFQAGEVDGLYFALPTRTAATQIYRRVVEAIARVFRGGNSPAVILAVPGYLSVDEHRGTLLPGFEVLWNDDDRERFRFRGWAAESPKRFLAGPIVVGTIDQALLSALMVSHAHLRATALMRHLLIIDEVHASDAYMVALMREVLINHLRAGGHAMLMSATLGSSARTQLLSAMDRKRPLRAPNFDEAVDVPYPLVTIRNGPDTMRIEPNKIDTVPKRVVVHQQPWADEPMQIALKAIDAAAAGARVLVVRNTVSDCVATQAAAEAIARERGHQNLLFRCAGYAAPHHARFARDDRSILDEALESAFGKTSTGAPCVAIATQTVQQSLDLDADLMLTDLCPADVLLQRIGRLHRHRRTRPAGFEHPRVIVVTTGDRDLGNLIRPNGEARGRHGFGSVYDDLRIIEATWRAIEKRNVLEIPAMNRMIVEETTHPDALNAIVNELGGRWKAHARTMMGHMFASRGQADLSRFDRSKPFGDFTFPSKELSLAIRTRLGEDDRIADFAPALLGLFGLHVLRLTIPAFLAKGAPFDSAPSEVAVSGGQIQFAFANRKFIYDRLGLRRVDDPADPLEDEADA